MIHSGLRFGRAAMLASLLMVPALAATTVTPAAAQSPQPSPLTIALVGDNPGYVELGVQTFQDFGVRISGGTAPYGAVQVFGAVDSRKLGTYTLRYSVTDSAGRTATATRTVIVRDTIAPTVDAATVINSIWPPNHKMVNVGLSARIFDAGDSTPDVRVSVLGDDNDEEQNGDGRHSPDALGIAPAPTLRLRAERKGNADGRVYLILVKATDDSGNVGYDTVTVVVPHSQSKKAIASVNAQAAAAQARTFEFFNATTGNGFVPFGFFVVGDGPVLGPHQ